MSAMTLLLLAQATSTQTATSGLGHLAAAINTVDILRVALYLVIGIPLVWAATRWIQTWATKTYSAQRGLVIGKVIFYSGLLLLTVSVLNELGFKLTALMGAAGILGVALGFASQTSVSNLIAGFFLIAEEPFKVGDAIQVGDVTGQVLTIDTLSVKIRTFDNRMVRIPNETLVKSEVTTITRFPIRRMDISIGVAYKEDAERVRRVLMEVATANPHVLMEPEPLFINRGFGASSLDLTFAAWTRSDQFLSVRNQLTYDIKVRFDAEGIEIPFPHVSLYTGSVTDPFPVRIERDQEKP
jgi:small-conductance mechanosensitive channel